MAVSIQRPSGVNVGVNNPGDTVYISGNDSTDGATRFMVDSAGVAVFQIRVAGEWVPGNLQFSTKTWVVDSILGEYVLDELGQQIYEGIDA